jgi:hypothetical protein
MLVYAMEAADFERGRAAFLNSTLAIDSEHKQVMRDVLAGPAPAELLYDCTV